jgi:hypothetical protein
MNEGKLLPTVTVPSLPPLEEEGEDDFGVAGVAAFDAFGWEEVVV